MAVYKADILDVELNTGNIARSFLCHNIGKDDTKADRFGVRVYRDGEPESLSGCSIQGYMMRPNGTNLAITGSNTGVSGNEAWVDLPQAAYDYEGQFCLALKLIGGGVTGTIRIIDGMINNTFVDDALVPMQSVPTYQEILAVYDQMVAAKNGSVRFDQSQSLTETQKSVARMNIDAANDSDVADLKSALTDVSAGFGESLSFYPIQRTGKGWIPSNKEVGETINLSDIRSSTDETTGYWIVPCAYGDKLTVTTTGNVTAMRAFALLDENDTVLYISSKQTASLERHVFTVDNEGAVKALIQSRTEETQYFGEYKNIESRFTAIEDNHATLVAKVGNDLTITSAATVPYIFEVGKSYNVQNNSDALISFRTRLSPSTDNVEQFNVSAGKTVVFTCTQIADGVSISIASSGTTIAVSIQKIGSMTYNIEANTERIVSLEESNVEISSKLDNVENKIRITDNTKHAYTIKAGVSYRITNNSAISISFRRWNGEELVTPNTTVNSGITKIVTWESQTDKVSVYISEGSRDVIVEEIGTIDNRIATNTERINALEANIPDYFTTMMETKLPIIRANMNEVGQYGDTFIFITDMHWDRNAKNSPSLIKYILDNTNINKILCGGDLISQGERNKMMQDMNDSIKSLEFPFHRYLLVAFGNHDSNKMVSNPSTEHFDLNTCYALLEKETESYITMMTDYDLSFYYDNKANKTRYIVLDTGEDSGSSGRSFTAYQEFADVLLDTPQNWHIVVMAHIVTYGRFAYIGAMMSAYNAKSTYSRDGVGSFDFTNAKGYIDCAFGGHTHVDSTFTTSGGIPVIVTTTDSDRVGSDDPYTYTKGTDQEQAFDVVTINYVAKTVKCVRIGRGVDRTINYQ